MADIQANPATFDPAALDATLKRSDPDRWLSSRLVADPAKRAALVALYSFDNELATVATRATNPTMGEIRFAWWAEEARAALSGAPTSNSPVAQALSASRGLLSVEVLEALIEARHAELDPEPFSDEAALIAYLDAVDGGVMAAAALTLAPDAELAGVKHAARAWGWMKLQGQGWAWRPARWREATDAEIASHLADRIRAASEAAKSETVLLPVSAFPAVAHATLARAYATGRRPSELEKRARLLLATTRGRV